MSYCYCDHSYLNMLTHATKVNWSISRELQGLCAARWFPNRSEFATKSKTDNPDVVFPFLMCTNMNFSCVQKKFSFRANVGRDWSTIGNFYTTLFFFHFDTTTLSFSPIFQSVTSSFIKKNIPPKKSEILSYRIIKTFKEIYQIFKSASQTLLTWKQ